MIAIKKLIDCTNSVQKPTVLIFIEKIRFVMISFFSSTPTFSIGIVLTSSDLRIPVNQKISSCKRNNRVTNPQTIDNPKRIQLLFNKNLFEKLL